MKSNDPAAQPAFGYASRNLTAERLGFSAKRLDQLVDEGWIPKADRGQYDQLAAFQGVLAYHRDSARRASKSSVDDELKQLRIRREKLKLAAQEGELIPLADTLGMIGELAGTVRLAIQNIPARYTRNVAERDRLQVHTDEALTEIAGALDKQAAALRAGVPDEPADD